MSNFTHLHVHNTYSYLDGFGSSKMFAERAKSLGMTHLALTNHGNIDGAVRHQKACDEAGVKPIFGIEFYIVANHLTRIKQETRRHILCLAKNETGWHNLLKLQSQSFLKGHYYRPRISPQLLLDHCEGLIVSTACVMSFLHDDWGLELFHDLRKKIHDDLYCEIQPLTMDGQQKTNTLALELADRFKLRIVATNDVHYPLAEDQKVQEVLLAIQSNAKWKDKGRWRFDAENLFLASRQEMIRLFLDQGHHDKFTLLRALNTTNEIAEKCTYTLKQQTVKLPAVPGIKDEIATFRSIITQGLKDRFSPDNKRLKQYKRRIGEEYGLIVKQGFHKYFLIVWDFLNHCREMDIEVGPGRGSVGGSLVAYLMNIHDANPLKYNLLFSRFITPDRPDLPDIDMDIEDIRRDEAIKYLVNTYGPSKVAGLQTFMAMKGPMAFRDVCRVFDVPNDEVNFISKQLPPVFTYEEFKAVDGGADFLKKYPKIFHYTVKLIGQIRGVGQHAAGVCISDDDLTNGRCAALSMKDGRLVANWDKQDAEFMGLMKLDVLGLSTLTVLKEAVRLVKKHRNIDINLRDIPLDDSRVYDMLNEGQNTGVFQFCTRGLTRFCQEMGIKRFKDTYHATALFRPGPLQSGLAKSYVERKRRGKKWVAIHPIIEEITKDTFGIFIFQEQIMFLVNRLAGLDWVTTCKVRKVMGKSQGDEAFMQFKDVFVKGCTKMRTLKPNVAGKLWDELSTFSKYAFNLSHSVEYSIISYRTAWMKVNYPAEFMAGCLSYSGEEKSEIIDAAVDMGLKVKLPKIGKSDPTKWTIHKGVLYAPFNEIKGLGPKAVGQIARLGTSRMGFFGVCNASDLPPKVAGLLNSVGAFSDEDVPYNRNLEALFDFDVSLALDDERD